MRQTKGKFIVIDGGDGAGKDTQVELIKRALRDEDVLYTRMPGGTDVSLAIRSLVLSQKNSAITPKAELLLFLAARTQTMEEQIEPALARGMHVVCQRFDLSTIAYQIYGREQLELLSTLQLLYRSFLNTAPPDLYILLDVDPRIGVKRTMLAKGESRDRLEREALVFHTRANDALRKHITDYPNYLVIDADRDIDAVYEDLLKVVQKTLQG